ncbi:MAG: BatD family protein [Pseudohongiellaceae bacterium]
MAVTLLVMAVPTVAQDNIVTRVDNDDITHGETLTMTVEVYDRQGNVPIDITVLEEDFDVVSSRTSSQLRTINGRVQARTRYELVLFPKRAGEQTIPPIEIGGYESEPIDITVNERTADDPRNENLYLETSLSADSVYVQEELLFTIRLLFRLDGIRNPDFTELDMDDTVIQHLGPPDQYEQIVDGQRYGVYEIDYAIFPQRSGELEIPDIFFRAQLTDGSSRSIFRNNNIETITAFAEGYQVEVKPRPAGYPEDATWLPARSLSIREQWSRDITNLEPGDSVERTITIEADGLDGAAIPPLGTDNIERMNLYPESPDVERTIIDGQVVGTRSRSWSMVPTEPGSVVIPEIRIPWWNTDEERLEYAVLDEAFITVRDPSGAGQSATPDQEPDAVSTEPSSLLQQPDDLVRSPTTPVWIFTIMTALMAAAGIAMMMLYRRKQSLATASPASPSVAVSAAYRREISDQDEKQAYQDLMQRCRQGTPGAVRLALIAWARQYYDDPDLHTLDALVQRAEEPQLASWCHRLQQALYAGKHSVDLDDETRQGLADCITRWRTEHQHRRRDQRRTERYSLPPLYRN